MTTKMSKHLDNKVHILLRFERDEDTRIVCVYKDRKALERRKQEEEGRGSRLAPRTNDNTVNYYFPRISYGICTKTVKGVK